MLEERLSDADLATLAEHLETCSACRQTLDHLSRDPASEHWRRLRASAADPGEEPPARFLRRLKDASTIPAFVVQAAPLSRPRPPVAVFANPAPPTPEGYEILGELGRGGIGVVYKARQVKLKRTVALKMLLAGGLADEEELARFRAEAEVIARLQHPNIVQIHDIGEQEGRPFLALEYVEGWSLAEHLDGTPQPPQAAAELVETLARAIHHAHQHGIVHRDLKPANVLLAFSRGSENRAWAARFSEPRLNEDGAVVKITDFGLAKRLDEVGQTQTGQILGTPSYMAPEQARLNNRVIGPPADVYALGAILYQLLTGRPPFQGLSSMDTIVQVLHEDPVPPRRLQPGVPRDLDTICLKSLEKDPAKRYASAAALAEDLRRYRSGQPILARRVGVPGHVWRWCRRNPMPAGLLAILGLVLVGAFAGITGSYFAAEKARGQEALSREQEHQQRELAELNLYYSRIALAHHEWLANDVQRARHLLEQCVPQEGQLDRRGWEWHYLRRMSQAYLATRHEHTFPVYSVAFSPDGHYLISAAGDPGYQNRPAHVPGELFLWKTDPLRKIGVFKGHTGRVSSAVFSHDGSRIASLSADGTVRLWDVAQRRQTAVYPGVLWWGAASPAFSPDGKTWAMPDGGVFKLRELGTDQVLARFDTEQKRACHVVFSRDGKLLAGIGTDGAVNIWDVATRRRLSRITGEFWRFHNPIAFSPDGKFLAAVEGNSIKAWQTQSGEDAFSLHGHTGQVRAIVWSPDGRHLASGSVDQTVRLWDIRTRKEAGTYRGHATAILSVAYRPNGKQIVSSDAAGVLIAWDVSRWQEVMVLPGMPELSDIGFTSDGQQVVAAARDGMRTWNAGTGELASAQGLKPAQRIEWPLKYVALSSDCRLYAVPAQENPTLLRVWDVRANRELATLHGHQGRIRSVAFSPDSRRLASASHGGPGKTPQQLLVWQIDGSKVGPSPLSLACPVTVQSLAFSADGQLLVAGELGDLMADGKTRKDGCVSIWEVSTGRLLRRWVAHSGIVQCVAIDPSGRWVASGVRFGDQRVRLWDAATGERLHDLHGPVSLTCLTFSPDGRRLAAVGYDGAVQLWDPATGHNVLVLRPPGAQRPENVASDSQVVFSRDGTRLAANNWTQRILVWDGRPLPADHEKADSR
jgi:WD40 repeat protein/tRNA A-37 threonylcarbamoyl transferase component Bud32